MIDRQRIPANVKLMAVTKSHTREQIKAVINRYQPDLIGESRWQEAQSKLVDLPANLPKHFIGHVQSNKLKEIMAHFECIESVDSIRLLKMIDKHAAMVKEVSLKYPVMLQVNISNDPNKYGFKSEQLNDVISECKKLFHVELLGFMAITAKQSLDQTRADFKRLKQLRQFYQLEHLSMGMSADWEVAIQEGATIVRIGQALFE